MYVAPKGADRKTLDRYDSASEAANRALASIGLQSVSLEKSIPETQARFGESRRQLEAEKDPLTQRYDNLIAEIKGYGEKAVKNTGTDISRELGRRGISTTSGLGEKTITEGVNPILAEYAAKTKDTGFAKEEGLRNLVNQIASLTFGETDAVRAIRNAMAQINVTGSQSAANQTYTGLQDYLTRQQQQQAAEEAQRQFDLNLQLEQFKADTSRMEKSGSSSGGDSSGFNPGDFIKDQEKAAAAGFKPSIPPDEYLRIVDEAERDQSRANTLGSLQSSAGSLVREGIPLQKLKEPAKKVVSRVGDTLGWLFGK
jgi:hypothetical protein